MCCVMQLFGNAYGLEGVHWVHDTACASAGRTHCGGVKQDDACHVPTHMRSVLLLLLRSVQVTYHPASDVYIADKTCGFRCGISSLHRYFP